jgi:hypothetical protein
MPDLNWELWRLRQSDEVARHLRREAELAAVRESQRSGALTGQRLDNDAGCAGRRECNVTLPDQERKK